jgi:hypothetical protein
MVYFSKTGYCGVIDGNDPSLGPCFLSQHVAFKEMDFSIALFGATENEAYNQLLSALIVCLNEQMLIVYESIVSCNFIGKMRTYGGVFEWKIFL